MTMEGPARSSSSSSATGTVCQGLGDGWLRKAHLLKGLLTAHGVRPVAAALVRPLRHKGFPGRLGQEPLFRLFLCFPAHTDPKARTTVERLPSPPSRAARWLPAHSSCARSSPLCRPAARPSPPRRPGAASYHRRLIKRCCSVTLGT